jgi:hypothetical protein
MMRATTERDGHEKGGVMTWSHIIRLFAAVVLASALAAFTAALLAGDAWSWSDRMGFGAFLIAVGVLTATMVWGHRMHQL